jgi:hypothetical protein
VTVQERSKQLFQRYCQLRGYRCCHIATSNKHGVRTPDFEVFVNNTTIIAETKELTANPDDIRFWREERAGKIIVHGREPGKRARDAIEAARGQLRPYAEAEMPTVVVLYDNIVVDGIRVKPEFPFTPLTMTDIDVALYGLWQANVRIHPGSKVQSLGDTRSRYRQIWRDREIFSAVVVLCDYPDSDRVFTITYHNYWASTPLPRNVFDGENDFHFAKTTDPDIQPNSWVRI